MKLNRKGLTIACSILGTGALATGTSVALTSCSLFGLGNDKKPGDNSSGSDNNTYNSEFNAIQEDSLLFSPMIASKARTLSVNVGMGDAEIIQVSSDDTYGGSDDFTILIDGGTGGAQGGVDASSPQGNEAVPAALNWLNVQDIDLFVMSHPHNDHLYAMPEVILNYATDNSKALLGYDAWAVKHGDGKNGQTGTTSIMRKTLKSLSDKNVDTFDSVQITNYVNNKKTKGNWTPANLIRFNDKSGNEIGSFSVLGCTGEMLDKNNKPVTSMNAYSVSNMFTFNKHKELFAGDSEGETDAMLMEYYRAETLKCDVYKVSHHGSGTEGSNKPDWLNTLKPTYAIISSGGEDKYTLPDTSTLSNLINAGVKPENILGTQPFGKSVDLAKQTSKNNTKIIDSWKKTDKYLNENQTINNNNLGASLIFDNVSNTYKRPTGNFVDLLTTKDKDWTDKNLYYKMVMKGIGIAIDFTGSNISFSIDANTVKNDAWNPIEWDNEKYTPVPPGKNKKWIKFSGKYDDYVLPKLTKLISPKNENASTNIPTTGK